MLNVFLTVDTELWPLERGWPRRRLAPLRTDFSRERALYIDGATADGEFGLAYQIATFNRHRLKACFFVEALCAARTGRASLECIVGQVRQGGHEVQLHLHTEWLRELREPGLPKRARAFMHQYTRREQATLIRYGMDSLVAAGAAPPRAFRAGSFGANRDTLRALAECGVAFDSSCNPTRLHADWSDPDAFEQPAWIDGVVELPVSSFRDYPGHRRHAQLCACSLAEMTSALLSAWQAGWYSFVIVLHSFELVKRRRAASVAAADHVNIERFERLCEFLAAHRDKFATRQFGELDPAAVPLVPCAPALHSPLAHTLQRVAEQGWSRCNWTV